MSFTKKNQTTHSNIDENKQSKDEDAIIEVNRSSSPFNRNPALVNDVDDINDEDFSSFPSSSDTQALESQPSTASNQTSVHQPTLPSSTSVSYGVDWSDRVSPISHCWFPPISSDISNSQPCSYAFCVEVKSTQQSKVLLCESCGLTTHSHHLNDSQATKTNSFPPCRPSFINIENGNNATKYDEHFWHHVSSLKKPCLQCQPTSKTTTLFSSGSNRLTNMSPFDIVEQVTAAISSIPSISCTKALESSNGLVCLWCARCYHQSCWEHLITENGEIKCDYGIFRNLIVRPQWLSRFSKSPTGFKAQVLPHSTYNDSDPKSFPYAPVLMFINKRSGGQVGEEIYRRLLRKLNPRQVFLLENDSTITHALNIYSLLPNIRICVFGGDGTVGWVLNRLAEAYPSRNNPPVSICPLGTGNDLSRVLSWGEQYDAKRLFHALIQIPQARVVALDRWKVQLEQIDTSTYISPTQQQHESTFTIGQTLESLFMHPKFVHETNRALYQNHHKLPNTHFINYMSFGLDAAIALDFHEQRTRDPSKFSSPLKNKLMYLNETGKYLSDFARANIWNLGSYIRLICDGHDLTNTINDCHTLVILNIPGYASGTNPWGNSTWMNPTAENVDQSVISEKDKNFANQILKSFSTLTGSGDHFVPQDFGDRKIEVVGLNTTHMATIHVGLHGKRIAQCNRLRIELLCPMTAQMDGEPFYLSASVAVNIDHADQVLVLTNENK